MTTKDAVIAVLRCADARMTSREVHARIPGVKFATVSSTLCRMALWGEIDREIARSGNTQPGREFSYAWQGRC